MWRVRRSNYWSLGWSTNLFNDHEFKTKKYRVCQRRGDFRNYKLNKSINFKYRGRYYVCEKNQRASIWIWYIFPYLHCILSMWLKLFSWLHVPHSYYVRLLLLLLSSRTRTIMHSLVTNRCTVRGRDCQSQFSEEEERQSENSSQRKKRQEKHQMDINNSQMLLGLNVNELP